MINNLKIYILIDAIIIFKVLYLLNHKPVSFFLNYFPKPLKHYFFYKILSLKIVLGTIARSPVNFEYSEAN